MNKLEELRRRLNESEWGKSYNEAEEIHRMALPISSLTIGSGAGYFTNQIASNFDKVLDGARFFYEYSYVLAG